MPQQFQSAGARRSVPVAPSGDCSAERQTPEGDAQGRGPDAPAAGRGAAEGIDWPAPLSGLGNRLAPADLPDPTAANAVTACDLSLRAAFLEEPDIPESPQISPP